MSPGTGKQVLQVESGRLVHQPSILQPQRHVFGQRRPANEGQDRENAVVEPSAIEESRLGLLGCGKIGLYPVDGVGTVPGIENQSPCAGKNEGLDSWGLVKAENVRPRIFRDGALNAIGQRRGKVDL